MRAQAASTERASAYRNACPSDVRRAEAVFTTAVANSEENSTLASDAMHWTPPLKRRRPRDVVAGMRVEDEGAAVAPAHADPTE